MPRLFCYGTLNIHDVQRSVWGEPKEGFMGRLLDFELKMWPKTTIFYVEPRLGETVVGKMYEITDEQMKKTDKYEGKSYKRMEIKDLVAESFYVYVPKSLKEDARNKAIMDNRTYTGVVVHHHKKGGKK